jgi:hypothetical protein
MTMEDNSRYAHTQEFRIWLLEGPPDPSLTKKEIEDMERLRETVALGMESGECDYDPVTREFTVRTPLALPRGLSSISDPEDLLRKLGLW